MHECIEKVGKSPRNSPLSGSTEVAHLTTQMMQKHRLGLNSGVAHAKITHQG